jgi:hypothetical protein
MGLRALLIIVSGFAANLTAAQEPSPAEQPVEAPSSDSAAPAPDAGIAAPPPEAAGAPEAAPETPRGDVPVSMEAVINEKRAEEPPPPPPPPSEHPHQPQPETPAHKPPPVEIKELAPVPLVTWATADWSAALGLARCGPQGLEGAETAIRIASTLKRSTAAAGLGVAPAGLLGDHPLLRYAAHEQPERLADLIAASGIKAIALGIADVNGPLLREPQLSRALSERGVAVIASNFVCNGQAFCQPWGSAEDPLPIIERDGHRYALIAVLPDDMLARVEPADSREVQLQPVDKTLVVRTEEARKAGADLVVATIDHGPDATAAVNLANFVASLPPDMRPDLMFSPSSGDSLLFMRPLDVQPAIVGVRSGALMGVRVTKLPGGQDSDVFARSVRQDDWNDELAAQLQQLARGFCEKHADRLRGGQLDIPLSNEGFVELAGAAVRELADADLAVVDPQAYESRFEAQQPVQLQRGQVERSVLLDSPLVQALVTLDWLGNLQKTLTGLRPLVLIGAGTDHGDPVIAGRIPVTGAQYRIVTSAVLARSDRLPSGVDWSPIEQHDATLRGALIQHLEYDSKVDPRARLRDPIEGTQWLLRTDGQIQANLTAVKKYNYDEPALQVNESRQLGARLLLNLDADAPKFLFENALQVGFDRNFATKTTAQDLAFLQTTYTYRGLWPDWMLYPHPFAEGYFESQFDKTHPTDGTPAYHHLLIRPKAGLRSMATRLLSLKVAAGFQYEVFLPGSKIYPGLGAELLLKPWTIPVERGTVQLEGNVVYYWNSPGKVDDHTLRGQVILGFQMIGPLQFTFSALGVLRKRPDTAFGQGITLQAGVRLRFVSRSMSD